MPFKKSIIWKILLAVYLVGLFFCCLWNFKGSIDLNKDLFEIPMDKIVHFLLFFPFPFICHWAFPRLRSTYTRLLLFLAAIFLIGSGIGAGIEALQGMSDYRSQDSMDLLADCLGLASASVILLIYNWSGRKICQEED